MGNLLLVVLALTAALVLPLLKKIIFHSGESGKKGNKREQDESKYYRKAEYVLVAMIEIANLINLIILIA
ncbi:unnamed protein product [Cylicocyclus nassatus]|uniref:Uncharacterized protein n=1 Tax=Cylicocyclus nassatus TaxID=53992 RepID=A0AA36H527_CYLNA|nr:unnamed protein product [Cylicocyclus nassatus]